MGYSGHTHGHARGDRRTILYTAWMSMLQRCNNPHHKYWKRYGGRGIKVQLVWHKFENFRDDVVTHPGKGWTLDRPDNNGDYGPDNWRWATRAMQARNRSTTKLTSEKVEDIRRQLLNGKTSRSIAFAFGVSQPTVTRIGQRKIWA